MVDRHGDRPHAHDAEIAGDELDTVLRENADTGARPDTAAQEAAADGVAQGIELKRGELPCSRFITQIDDGATLAMRRKLQNIPEITRTRMILRQDSHGLSSTLPTTSRSSSRRSPSAVSSSGSTLSMTGTRRPSATRSSSILRSSLCQPLEPISVCS